MTDIKERILADAIRISIKNQKQIDKLKKIVIWLSSVIACLIVIIIVLLFSI